MAKCINIKHKDFIKLLEDSKLPSLVLEVKIAKWQEENNSDEFPSLSELSSDNQVNYQFKSVNKILQNFDKVKQWYKQVQNPPVFWEKLQKDLGIPKEQVELLKQSYNNVLNKGREFDKNNPPNLIEEALLDFIANYSYTVEINTAKESYLGNEWQIKQVDEGYDAVNKYTKERKFFIELDDAYTFIGDNKILNAPTQHYSNLTVPGGTNYTENEISTPGVEIEEKPQGIPVKEGVKELFESNPELANAVYEALGFENYNGITVELGRSKVVERGKIQNIIVKYNGKPIIGENKESGLGEMNVMIQSKDAFVGMIRIPTELQGKGLSKYIYQATADLIGIPIINSKERGESQTESGGYVWKNRTSFQPNQITPQQKQQALQLYSQYLDTIFPDSKVKDIVYHGSSRVFNQLQYNKEYQNKIIELFIKNYPDKFGKILDVNSYNIKILKAEKVSNNNWHIGVQIYEGKNKIIGAGIGLILNDNGITLFENNVSINSPIPINNSFNKNYIGSSKQIVHFEIGDGFYFTNIKEEALRYGELYTAILDIKNPSNPRTTYKLTPQEQEWSERYYEGKRLGFSDKELLEEDSRLIPFSKKLQEKGFDGIITPSRVAQFVVFEPEQIHILGSKQDIEGFKSFIKSNTKTVRKGAITPSIKGHAQFATDKGIGWFRSDEQRIDDNKGKKVPDGAGGLVQLGVITDSKTRRILEIQSDLFQKGRGKDNLTLKEESKYNANEEDGDIHPLLNNDELEDFDANEFLYKNPSDEIIGTRDWGYGTVKEDNENYYFESGDNKYSKISKVKYEQEKIRFAKLEKEQLQNTRDKAKQLRENQFLQLLNKDNNWVTFFVKSIIQDTAKQTVTEVQESDVEAKVRELEKEGLLEIDCKGKLKAEKGLQTNFTKGGRWKIYEIFEGKSHKQGGIDINIKNNQISFTNKNGSIKAKYGLVISKENKL